MKYSKEELLKIWEECISTSKLMSMEFEKYGPKGIELLKKLYNLKEDDRSKEIPTK